MAQRTHFPELVADEQNAAAFGGESAQGNEQVIGLLRRQHRSRFIENQQADVLHQAANDFHPLPFTDRQAVDKSLRFQRHAVAPGHFANLRLKLFGCACRRAHGQGDVLCHAQGFEQRKMLEYHADSQTPGLGRIAQAHPLTLPDHLAGIGVGNAVDDLHQRAFARTVFAEQGMDLARGNGQVDGIVGQAAGVAFCDSAQLQARNWVRDWSVIGHDRLSAVGLVPVDKAIFWPLGQENLEVLRPEAFSTQLSNVPRTTRHHMGAMAQIKPRFCSCGFAQKMSNRPQAIPHTAPRRP
ncbi:hypothetical protein D9M69_470720 [compost metagenome]